MPDTEDIVCTVLKPPPFRETFTMILRKMSVPDQIDLCSILNIYVPGIWPVFSADRQGGLVNKYLKTKKQILLPAHVIIENEGLRLYYGPKRTMICESEMQNYKLAGLELDNYYVITKSSNDIGDEDANTEQESAARDLTNQQMTQQHISDNLSTEEEVIVSGPCDVQYTHEDNSQQHISDNLSSEQELIVSGPCYVQFTQEDNSQQHISDNLSAEQEFIVSGPSNVQNDQEDISQQHISHNLSAEQEVIVPGPSEDNVNVTRREEVTVIDPNTQQEIHNDTVRSYSAPSSEQEAVIFNQVNDTILQFGSGISSDATTFESLKKEDLCHTNLFLHPEKLNNETFLNLIHISKSQFLDFVKGIKIIESRELSKYSKAFLFRMKLASNWSFGKLATLFGIDQSTA